MGSQKTLVKESARGFTIIEVMIVLVIAAVIMLIVFFAVPALQRNQRNVRRSRDAAALATLIRECMTNNQNNIYACGTPENIGLDPSATFSMFTGAHYGSSVFPAGEDTSVPPTIEEPNWLFGLKCTPNLTWFTSESARPRDFVITYFRETPNAPGVFSRCLDG